MTQNRESYLLNRSPEFDLTAGAENRTDLALTPSPDLNKGIIVTTVMSGDAPVVNALVKILTLSGDPVDHQFTNASGLAASLPLSSGIYQVVTAAPGYITSLPVTANVPASNRVIVDISIATDPRAAQNTLYGLVLDNVTGNRISNASVILSDSQGQTVTTTQTDNDGEYLIYDISNGSYTIIAEKTGYQLSESFSINVTGSQIAETNIPLTPDVITEGTVQGFIKDENGNLLSGATVGLYSVTNSTETLIQQTLTNANGYYLFGGVVAGKYLVKSKVEITL